jgi:hypothetical protein
VIQEEAPDAIKAGEIKNQFGRKVAIVGTYAEYLNLVLSLFTGCVELTLMLILAGAYFPQVNEHLLVPDCSPRGWPTAHV